MNKIRCILFIVLVVFYGCNLKENKRQELPPGTDVYLSVSPEKITFKSDGSSQNLAITSNVKWSISTSGEEWLTVTPPSGTIGSTSISVSVTSNYSGLVRWAELTVKAGATSKICTIKQETGVLPNYVPEGYSLVWQDEFDSPRLVGGKPALPNLADWNYETGAHGWRNHEIQNYIPGYLGKDTCAQVYSGTLKIIAKNVGNQVFSARMNTHQSWTYGYFEARIKLPSGKGTWPAFWMLPKNFVNWPDSGEIDIMEHVGYDPNKVHCTIHSKAYNHSMGTQKGASRYVSTAISDFHIYAIEWTEDYIYGFVDGVRYFTFLNDKTENKDTWPFNVPFYLKLNLAWGGDWGGAQGVDFNALPAIYEIDYVRVYQK